MNDLRKARLNEENVVVELLEAEGINNRYHPDFVKTLVDCEDTVSIGMIYDSNQFSFSVESQEQSIASLRENMMLSAAQARLNLAKAGLLLGIIVRINALPDDAELKIMWEYETVFKRLDPTLVEFCKQSMGMSDEAIDNLFMS